VLAVVKDKPNGSRYASILDHRCARRPPDWAAGTEDAPQGPNQGLGRRQGHCFGRRITHSAQRGGLRKLPLLGAPTDEAGVHLLIEPEYLYRVFYRVQGKQVMEIGILRRAQD
jgi:hypothetical protein